MGRKILPLQIIKGSKGVQDLVDFTIGSDGIIDPILHFQERSSGIKDPAVRSMRMCGLNLDE